MAEHYAHVLRGLGLAPAGFVAFRTPLLPVSMFSEWSEGLAAPSASDAELAEAVARDSSLLQERLRAIIADPVVREALFVASPTLDDAVDAWLADPRSERAAGVVEIVTRYFSRMCTRPTPFGLFSGCSIGGIGGETQLHIEARNNYVRHTRLDTLYLAALCEELSREESLRAALHFRPSTGLFRSADQFRYAESKLEPTTRERIYSLVSVDCTSYLAATLDRAAHGRTLADLAGALVAADPELTEQESRGYVAQLIDEQILVPDLAPAVTGLEPIDDILATLSRAGADLSAHRLASVALELKRMDASGLGQPLRHYKDIATALSELPAAADLPRLFQVDLYKKAPGATLGARPLRELCGALDALARFRPDSARATEMTRFREAFRDRYGEREVPLTAVLDEDTGIGFGSPDKSSDPSPLLNDLDLPPGEREPPRFGQRESWFLRRLNRLAAAGVREWALDATDVKALQGDQNRHASAPDAFAALCSLVAPSAEAIDAGNFRLWLQGISGPSGANLLGRFCHGDTEIARLVREHLRAEEALRPGVIFAEVVHLPDGRDGNVLCRPRLRDYEIPYLGRGSATEEKTISIEDLLVSVVGDRVVLRSSRLEREIVPRATAAHTSSTSTLGIYRFLGALQSQDAESDFRWSWGSLSGELSFLPRVTLGRVVLSLAQWTLRKDDLERLDGASAADRYRDVQAMRARTELPRWIGVADGDNVLAVDLDNVLQVESFVSLVKHRSVARLQELFLAPPELCARGPEGLFAHELVVPFVRSTSRPSAASRSRVSLARTFAPGSEWLFAKLYAGPATADRVLKDVVKPIVDETFARGDAEAWYFVRYADPRWHLRVRFQGEPTRLLGNVLPRLHTAVAPLLGDGRISKLVVDTYEREIERYGGDDGMLLSERLFRADSDAVLSIQYSLAGESAEDLRWRLCLRGMHLILADLGIDLPSRYELLAKLRGKLAAEQRLNGCVEKQLSAKFRKLRDEAEWLVRASVGEAAGLELEQGFGALARRSRQSAPHAAALMAHAEREGKVGAVATSLLHMHANRLLRSEHRPQELVLYDFLRRLYGSELARATKNPSQQRRH